MTESHIVTRVRRAKAFPLPAIVLGASLFLVTGAVNLPAPLYPAYAAMSGYGTGGATVAFAAYVMGLVPVLLLLGGLSDRIGRKVTILMALALAAGATILLAWLPGLETLFASRLLYGIGTGLITGTGTAFMVELLGGSGDPASSQRGAFLVTASTSLGFGIGALATGLCLLVQGPGTLLPASFLAYLPFAGLGAVALIGVVPERRLVRQSEWIRPPVFLKGTAAYGFAILIAWATVGLVISVFPAALAAHGMAAWSGFSTFLVISTGLLFQPLARRLSPTKAVAIGIVLVPLGYLLLATGALLPSLPLVLAGAAVTSAAAYGFTYLGGLAAVSAAATDADRARAASGYFLYAYFGFSFPVVTSGFLADRFGMTVALVAFGIATVVASMALGIALLRKGQA